MTGPSDTAPPLAPATTADGSHPRADSPNSAEAAASASDGSHVLRRLCVFCGSRPGARPSYMEGGYALGQELARQGIGLVYGGASVGVMGAVADGALSLGGEVIGVIPRSLALKEIFHENLSSLHVVSSMHERKAMMADLADGFIALPGGFGTFDELCEILTWAQLGIHRKPMGLLDIDGFFAPLLALFEQTLREGFISQAHLDMIEVSSDPGALLAQLRSAHLPLFPKWMEASQT